MPEDVVTVGLSEEVHAQLKRMSDVGVFTEMRDGYRLGLALAMAKGISAPAGLKTRTFVNIGTLDPDGSLRALIVQVYPEAAARPYAFAERLAEAGVGYLATLYESGQLRIADLADEVGLA